MAKLYEVLIVIFIWAVVLTSYASILGAIISISETNALSTLLLTYYLFNIYYHFNAMGKIQLREQDLTELFLGPRECQQLQSGLCGCTTVYFTCRALNSLAVDVCRFNERYLMVTTIVKIGILLTFIGWFFVIDRDSATQVVFFSLMVITQGLMAFLHTEFVVVCIEFAVALPFMALQAIFKGVWEMLGKPHGRRRQNAQQPVQVVRDPHQFHIDNEGNHNARVILAENPPVYVQPMMVVLPEPQIQPEQLRFDQVERTTTNKAMENIMGKWKRKFTIGKIGAIENCCVCLEDFNPDEPVIELKGNRAHIFHPHCLQNWAGRNRGCPLCRKNFVEMAKNEAVLERIQTHEGV